MAKIGTNASENWGKKLKTLPEAQRTQGIDSVSWVISKVEMKISCRDYLRYGVNTLGPLCLWQCFLLLCLFLCCVHCVSLQKRAPVGANRWIRSKLNFNGFAADGEDIREHNVIRFSCYHTFFHYDSKLCIHTGHTGHVRGQWGLSKWYKLTGKFLSSPTKKFNSCGAMEAVLA